MIGTRHISSIDAGKIAGVGNPDPWSRTFYVQSTHIRAADGGNHGLDKYHPLATLRQAIALSGVGDRIIIGAGHEETLSSSLVVASAGTQIIGLGQGDRRPKFTIDTVVSAFLSITGAGSALHNIHLAAGIDSLLSLVIFGADNIDMIDCLVTHDASFQVVNAIAVGANANCRVIGLRAPQAAVGATSCITHSTGANLEIHGCHITGDYSTGCINNTGVASQVLIDGNWLENLNAADNCITCAGTTTGRISGNRCRIATDTQTTWITAADCDWYENYGVNVDGETGVLIGTPSA